MFPPLNRVGVLTGVLVLACAAFSGSPRNAFGQDTPTPTASPSATATATPTASATASPTPTATATSTPTATATSTPTPTPTPTASTRLGNIATRSLIDVGDNVLIAGFIVTGAEPKKVIVRGIGPSLEVQGKLADPTLELRDGQGALLQKNDNWRDSPDKQAIFNARLEPKDNAESAILATLPAKGSSTYTAILRGVDGGTGIGLVEVYDLDSQTADSRLSNISTRGLVLAGDDVVIAGTIVIGEKPQEVIIRALGPSLSIINRLADPKLELRDQNGRVIGCNDNFRDYSDAEKEAFYKEGLAPTDERESAIHTTLPANGANYTAIVRNAGAAVDRVSPTVTRTRQGSGNTVEIQRVQLARAPVTGTLRLTFRRPSVIMSGQPGDIAALEDDTITVPWNATADDIKAAILASSNFYKYDQNNHLTDGPKGFHTLFDSGGGLGIEGNEGSRREPVVTGGASDFFIQFGTLTTGNVGIHNPWIRGLPPVGVDDSSIIYDGGVAVVEIYALHR